jgi:8-oxo-dGTP pyrophosphatase MutT (NUDIX family)
MPETTHWKPHVTVAAIIEQQGRFLLVKEIIEGQEVYNQPAGHLEPNETLQQAVTREVLEETAHPFEPLSLVGVYRFVPGADKTYLRFEFSGTVFTPLNQPLDREIVSAEWLDLEQIKQLQDQHRSPMVLQCILDYLNKPAYPLDVFSAEFE